jgi:hypothetical protein
VAGLAFAGLVIGLEIVRAVLVAMTDRPLAHVLSVQADLRAVGSAIFGITVRGVAPAAYPPIVLALLMVGCLLVLRSRVRAVEIVT